MKLPRNLYPVLINANALIKPRPEGYDWVRDDKSEQYELDWNAQTEDKQYIDSANNSSIVSGYQMSMEQEIILESTNRCFQLIDKYAWTFPTGSDTIIEVCLPRPFYNKDGNVDKKYSLAKVWKEASVVPGSLATVDGKYNFTLNLNGDPTDGYIDNDTWEFTEGEPPTVTTPPEESGEETASVQSLSSRSSSKSSDK